MLQEPLYLSNATQARIDHLEHLVHSLLNCHQYTQRLVDTPSSYIGAESGVDDGPPHVINSGKENHGVTEPKDKKTTTQAAKPSTTITINANYKQCLSVDQAHWALLLNEVRDINDSQPLLTR